MICNCLIMLSIRGGQATVASFCNFDKFDNFNKF